MAQRPAARARWRSASRLRSTSRTWTQARAVDAAEAACRRQHSALRVTAAAQHAKQRRALASFKMQACSTAASATRRWRAASPSTTPPRSRPSPPPCRQCHPATRGSCGQRQSARRRRASRRCRRCAARCSRRSGVSPRRRRRRLQVRILLRRMYSCTQHGSPCDLLASCLPTVFE